MKIFLDISITVVIICMIIRERVQITIITLCYFFSHSVGIIISITAITIIIILIITIINMIIYSCTFNVCLQLFLQLLFLL